MPAPGRNKLLLWGNRRYSEKVLSTQRANLITYWKLGEVSGTTVLDSSGNARNGTYTGGFTLGQTGIRDGGTAAAFDGSTGYGNVYSTSFRDAFNKDAGTIIAWVKATGWAIGTTRTIVHFGADGSNYVEIAQSSAAGTVNCVYRAGGTIKNAQITGLSATGFVPIAMTWDKAGDALKAYVNGVQFGATVTALGTWAGTLAATLTVIGAASTTPTLPFPGSLAHVAVWNVVLSAAEIARLATV